MRIFSYLFRSRDKPKNYLPGTDYSFFFGGTTSGKAVNERTAMQTTAVYACVRILAEAIGASPCTYTSINQTAAKRKRLTIRYIICFIPNPTPR